MADVEHTRGKGAASTARARRGTRALRIAFLAILIGKLVVAGIGYRGAFDVWAAAAEVATRHGADPGAPRVEAGRRGVEIGSRAADPAPGAIVATAGSVPVGRSDATGKPEVRALLEAVARRQAELDERERELGRREEKLQLFERDVTAKLASLEELEKRLQARAKSASAAVEAAAESLAKVYGAMKPEDAAPILERLDEPTVLTIFGRMKEKQIGEILPLMSRDKAIVLTRSLAERR